MVLALCAIDSWCLYPQCCPLEYKEHYIPIDSLSKEGAIRLLGKDPRTILTKFFHSPKEPSRRGKAWDQAGTRGDVPIVFQYIFIFAQVTQNSFFVAYNQRSPAENLPIRMSLLGISWRFSG